MRPATCVGVDETNEWLAEWHDAFENWSIDVEEVFDSGDQVVTVIRQRAQARQGGPEVEMRYAQVWIIRDGLLTRTNLYADRIEALAAAGLRD